MQRFVPADPLPPAKPNSTGRCGGLFDNYLPPPIVLFFLFVVQFGIAVGVILYLDFGKEFPPLTQEDLDNNIRSRPTNTLYWFGAATSFLYLSALFVATRPVAEWKRKGLAQPKSPLVKELAPEVYETPIRWEQTAKKLRLKAEALEANANQPAPPGREIEWMFRAERLMSEAAELRKRAAVYLYDARIERSRAEWPMYTDLGYKQRGPVIEYLIGHYVAQLGILGGLVYFLYRAIDAWDRPDYPPEPYWSRAVLFYFPLALLTPMAVMLRVFVMGDIDLLEKGYVYKLLFKKSELVIFKLFAFNQCGGQFYDPTPLLVGGTPRALSCVTTGGFHRDLRLPKKTPSGAEMPNVTSASAADTLPLLAFSV